MLYSKYRSSKMADVIGQESIVEVLKNQIISNNLAHAYLFIGTRGVGKTSIARIFANAINCLDAKEGEPCGICDRCKEIEKGTYFDIIEMDAASNSGVDNIRKILGEVSTVPVGKYKVYIIDEVHMLSTSAFNALLKTLEEPPANVIFILATTELHKVPATVVSRCQKFSFKRIDAQDIKEHLIYVMGEEKIGASEAALELIASLAKGSMRDALSILESTIVDRDGTLSLEKVQEALGCVSSSQLTGFLKKALSKEVQGALEHLDLVYYGGINMDYFIVSLVEIIKDALLFKTSKSSVLGDEAYLLDLEALSTYNLEYLLGILDALIALKTKDVDKSDIELFVLRLSSYNISDYERLSLEVSAIKENLSGKQVLMAASDLETNKTETASVPFKADENVLEAIKKLRLDVDKLTVTLKELKHQGISQTINRPLSSEGIDYENLDLDSVDFDLSKFKEEILKLQYFAKLFKLADIEINIDNKENTSTEATLKEEVPSEVLEEAALKEEVTGEVLKEVKVAISEDAEEMDNEVDAFSLYADLVHDYNEEEVVINVEQEPTDLEEEEEEVTKATTEEEKITDFSEAVSVFTSEPMLSFSQDIDYTMSEDGTFEIFVAQVVTYQMLDYYAKSKSGPFTKLGMPYKVILQQ